MDRADNQDNYEMHPSLVSVRPEWECQEDKEFLSAARMLIVYSTQEVFGGRTQSPLLLQEFSERDSYLSDIKIG